MKIKRFLGFTDSIQEPLKSKIEYVLEEIWCFGSIGKDSALDCV